ncbi:MAG: Uma2 family endonuclease [Planctomycetota bacterium]|nr:Uma2 family endonuclease [Planctomycetota bacterium]
MSPALKYAPRYTCSDYQKWEGRWELWEGVAVSMSPSPFGLHSAITSRLIHVLVTAIDASSCQASVLNEIDWIVADDTIVRPDIVVVCGGFPERHVESAPAIVVEVLSETTRSRDLTYKRELYRSQRVANYLIVDPDNESIVVDKVNSDGELQTIEVTDSLAISICDDCQIELRISDVFRC